jgi:hypothetical protein
MPLPYKEMVGVSVSESTLSRSLRKMGFVPNERRSVGASERDEFLRAAWRALVGGALDARRFVFVDEMGTDTSLCVLYGWAPRGRRAYFRVPRRTGVLTSRLALSSTTHSGMGPSLAVEDPTPAGSSKPT